MCCKASVDAGLRLWVRSLASQRDSSALQYSDIQTMQGHCSSQPGLMESTRDGAGTAQPAAAK